MKVNLKISLKKWLKVVYVNIFKKFVLLTKTSLKTQIETVEAFLKSKGGKLADFVRYEVGEGMEKREENFADEVKVK